MRWFALPIAACVALALVTLIGAHAELSISLEPLDDNCRFSVEQDDEVGVRWTVSGGRAPYEVWIAGNRKQGETGTAIVSCAGLNGRSLVDSDRELRSGPLTVAGTAWDATGVKASAVVLIERIATLSLSNGFQNLRGPGWFRAASVDDTFWLPSGYWEVGTRHDEPDLLWVHSNPQTYDCPQYGLGEFDFSDIARSHFPEPDWEWPNREACVPSSDDYQRITNSIGSLPQAPATSVGGVDSLSLELFAPAVCEASGWSRRSDRYGLSYRDERVAEVEWRVSGGQEPYTIYIAEEIHEGASGRLRIPCQAFVDGLLDSGLMSVAGFVEDANGATDSGIVQTYAVAERSGNRHSEQKRLNGGRTYRFWGILMTIPQGLEIDAARVGFTNVSCDPECESFYSVSTRGGFIWADFGETTGKMIGRGQIGDDWREDPGVNADSEAEIHAMMDQWANSVGNGPDLSDAPWINPAPLQISGYLDSLNCLPHAWRDQFQTGARINVSGGAWVPTGIEVNGRLVGLARGTAQIHAPEVPCTSEFGWQTLTLNVHDLALGNAPAEVDLWVLNLPGRYRDGSLRIRASAWQSEREQTAYCQPGSDVLIKWELRGAVEPFTVYVNSQPQGDIATWQWGVSGHARVPCLTRSGFQAHTIWAIDSASNPQRVMIPIILEAVSEHPSGRSWSDLRGAD